jgi:hypothetical protein
LESFAASNFEAAISASSGGQDAGLSHEPGTGLQDDGVASPSQASPHASHPTVKVEGLWGRFVA